MVTALARKTSLAPRHRPVSTQRRAAASDRARVHGIACAAARARRFARSLTLSSLSMLAAATGALASTAEAELSPAVCGHKASDASKLTATNCLFVLRTALGAEICTPSCVCDLNDDCRTTAADALMCLRAATDPSRAVDCCRVTSARLVALPGSSLDSGWNGLAHHQRLITGASITVAIVQRCDDDPSLVCTTDADCPSGACTPACGEPDTSTRAYEIAGPTGTRRCANDLAPCRSNTDCVAHSRCERFFGPPLPLAAAGTPVCVTTYFENDLVGTLDVSTGDIDASTFLRSRVHLGISVESPCPRCGDPESTPQVGDRFKCEGGSGNAAACTVDAVSAEFGGVSNDCPPTATANVSGAGLAIRLFDLTTGEVQRTASLPCLFAGVCTDDASPCQTNADCMRCTDTSRPCAVDADCPHARCAAAPDPDQPISCGFWCHCGFCNDDPSAPCFDDAECGAGERCSPGDDASGSERQPNNCSDLICGRSEPEHCCAAGDAMCPTATPLEGTCTQKPSTSCSTDPSDPRFGECERQSAGTCELERRPCFEATIRRSGQASARGRHCVDVDGAPGCVANGDCSSGACVADTLAPSLAALFCVPKTASGAINSAGGIPGPGTLTLRMLAYLCRCGDGTVGCDEECDDGNRVGGDGCDQACRSE
jgi:cysteine-rich repeat protein